MRSLNSSAVFAQVDLTGGISSHNDESSSDDNEDVAMDSDDELPIMADIDFNTSLAGQTEASWGHAFFSGRMQALLSHHPLQSLSPS